VPIITNSVVKPANRAIGSFQMSMFGLQAIMYRLMLAAVPKLDTVAAEAVHRRALSLCHDAVELVVNLTPADRGLFWMPCESLRGSCTDAV
jgi:hypothetical protein